MNTPEGGSTAHAPDPTSAQLTKFMEATGWKQMKPHPGHGLEWYHEGMGVITNEGAARYMYITLDTTLQLVEHKRWCGYEIAGETAKACECGADQINQLLTVRREKAGL